MDRGSGWLVRLGAVKQARGKAEELFQIDLLLKHN